jgi:hypothetical protein
MPTRCATSLIRSNRVGVKDSDWLDKFFLLDTGSGFL